MKKNLVLAAIITGLATVAAAVISVVYLNQSKQDANSNQNSNSQRSKPAPGNSSTPGGKVGGHTPGPGSTALDFRPVAGDWTLSKKQVYIKGEIYDEYGDITNDQGGRPNFAAFDIEGYDAFEGEVGVADPNYSNVNTLTIEVDGKPRQNITTSFGQPPQHIRIELTSAKSIMFSRKETYPHIIIGKPRLIKN